MRIELFKLDLQHLVEFSISASDENYKICSSDSFFMEEKLFYLFQSCFEASSKIFDYYEPTKYDLRNLVPLLNQLKNLEEEIGFVDSPESFKKILQNRSMGNQFLKHLEKEDTAWEKNSGFRVIIMNMPPKYPNGRILPIVVPGNTRA